MKKKNGVNLMFFVIITILFLNFSCSESGTKRNEGILLKADRDFSELSVTRGMFTAFLSYIADDGVILRDNAFPSEGKETLREYYKGKSDTSFILSWEPLYEQIAESGIKIYLPAFFLPEILFRARDAKIPSTESIEKIIKPDLIAEINPG